MTALNELTSLPGHLARRFQQIAVALFQNEMAREGLDLTSVQYAALIGVLDRPDIDQATLAGLIAYDRTTIGGVVDRLVQKGLLQRTVSPKDRRARALRLTDEGLRIISVASPAVAAAQENLLGGLEAQESRDLIRLLSKAITALNESSRAPLTDAD